MSSAHSRRLTTRPQSSSASRISWSPPGLSIGGSTPRKLWACSAEKFVSTVILGLTRLDPVAHPFPTRRACGGGWGAGDGPEVKPAGDKQERGSTSLKHALPASSRNRGEP